MYKRQVLGAALDDAPLLSVIDSDVAASLVVSNDVVVSSVPEHAARFKAVARLRMGRREVRRRLCIVDVLPVANSEYLNRYFLVVDVRQNAVRTDPIAPFT